MQNFPLPFPQFGNLTFKNFVLSSSQHSGVSLPLTAKRDHTASVVTEFVGFENSL